ncbi:DNA repair protein RecO [Candidatus Gottesmanbacteria bacterium]|nr:DNA repair protein RecO [Candidatus Gottesmanbacteria bacterium]
MSRYSCECIILKRQNFGEGDKIITVFAKKFGKMKVLAKGIRKIYSRRAPHLELFNQTRLHLYKGKNFDIITEAENVSVNENLKKDINKIATAYFLVEIVDRLCPEGVVHDDIYASLVNALTLLNHNRPEDQNLIKDAFANNLLHYLGFLPFSQNLKGTTLVNYIESILEGRLKTPGILTKVAQD